MVQRFREFETVPDDVWAQLGHADSLYVSRPWITALRHAVPTIPVEFWAIWDDEGWLAGLPVHHYAGPPPSPTYDPWRLHAESFDEAHRETARDRPHVVVGTRNGQFNGALRRGSDVGNEWIPGFCAALRSAYPDAVICWLYAPESLATSVASTSPKSLRMFADFTAQVHVTDGCQDFSDFIAKARGSIRRRLTGDRSGIDRGPGLVAPITDLSTIADLSPVLGELLANVMRRHGHDADPAGLANYVRALASPELSTELYLIELAGRPIAFSLCVSQGSQMSVRVVGLDHDAVHARPYMDYVNVAFHSPLERGMARGATLIDLGTGTTDTKLFRGADPVPVDTLVLFPDDMAVPEISTDGAQARMRELVTDSKALQSRAARGDASK